VNHDSLTDLDRTSLDRLKLAADVILGEGPNIPDPLTAELTIFRDQVERALLPPGAWQPRWPSSNVTATNLPGAVAGGSVSAPALSG
jgi:hypothetical protein